MTVAGNEIPKELGKIPLFQEIPNTGLAVDYSLSSDPVIENNSLTVSADASISNKDTLSENYSFPGPIKLPALQIDDWQLQVFLTEYVFDTFSYSLFSTGKLSNIRIDPQVTDKIDFNVLIFSIFWPNLLDKYKYNQRVLFDCGCNSYPNFSFLENNIEIKGDFKCDLLVAQPDGQFDKAFEVNLRINFGSFIVVEKGIVKVQIKAAEIKEFSTAMSTVGELHLEKLQEALNFVLRTAMPVANNFLFERGIVIPTVLDIDFGNAVVVLKDKYVKLDLTPVFHSSLLFKSIFKKDKFESEMRNSLKYLISSNKSGR
jgi:hypothetical protein